MANMWKLHRDPETWTNPDEFQPDRFLTSHAGVHVRVQHFKFIPFSSGRRSCLNDRWYADDATNSSSFASGILCEYSRNEIVDISEAAAITLHKKDPLYVVLTPGLGNKFYQDQEQVSSSLGYESERLKSQ
ncbi:strychnine-10-hydroxylase-like [Apium graveolens]|uniref:strychnine-10-hydroxylase-like n=1 Tax=Apium graveolens TaxID=4045 RepID=UPI003D7C0734